MPEYVVTKTSEALNLHSKSLKGAKLLVLGVAYKKGCRRHDRITRIDNHSGAAETGRHCYFQRSILPTPEGFNDSSDVMTSVSLDSLAEYDCVLICTDHSLYEYARIVREAQLVVDSRNATKGIRSTRVVHC